MHTKTLDLSQSVYKLCTQYPELTGILAEIGFRDITKPGILTSAGRFMTIPKGAVFKKISMESILSKLAANGFQVIEKGGTTE